MPAVIPSIIVFDDKNIIMTKITHDAASVPTVSCHNARHQIVIKVNKSWNLLFVETGRMGTVLLGINADLMPFAHNCFVKFDFDEFTCACDYRRINCVSTLGESA